MRRIHLLILIVVAIVLALVALRLNEQADLRPTTSVRQRTEEPSKADPPSEQRPAGSVGREDPGVGTTALPRGPGSLERP